VLHSSPESIIKISGFLAAIKLTDKSGYPDNGYPDLQVGTKISGFLAAIKLTDKSGYPDNGYPDLQTLLVPLPAGTIPDDDAVLCNVA